MRRKTIWIISIIILLAAMGIGGYYLYQRQQAQGLYELAQKAYAQKDYQKSLEFCRKITPFQLRLLPKLEQAKALINAGNCLYEMEKYTDALLDYQEAEKIIKLKSTQSASQASLFLKMGNLYFALEKYDDAIKYYEFAGKIWTSSNSDEIVQIFSNLATIYLEKNDFVLARNYYLLAIGETEKRDISQHVGIKNLALMYYYLADSCFELDMLSDAEIYCLKALSIINNNPELSELKRKIYHRLAIINFFKDKNKGEENFCHKLFPFPLPQILFPAKGMETL